MITYKDSWSLFKRFGIFWVVLLLSVSTLAIESSVKAVRNEKLKKSLDKSRIPKLSYISRKFRPEKQRKAMSDPFVERITRTRTDKGKKIEREECLKPGVKSPQKEKRQY